MTTITINGNAREVNEAKIFQGVETWSVEPGIECGDCLRENGVVKPAIVKARLVTTDIFLCGDHLKERSGAAGLVSAATGGAK